MLLAFGEDRDGMGSAFICVRDAGCGNKGVGWELEICHLLDEWEGYSGPLGGDGSTIIICFECRMARDVGLRCLLGQASHVGDGRQKG